MKLNRLKAITVKEMLQIWRDPRSLMIALLMPFMQILLLGYGVNLDVKHLPICIYDGERSQESHELVARFEGSPYFAIMSRPDSRAAVTRAIDAGTCRMAFVVPSDFSARLADGHGAVQAIVD